MSNLRANAERFKQKEAARLQQVEHEQQRFGYMSQWRNRTATALRTLLQEFPCPAARPDEAPAEAVASLLTLAAGFSAGNPIEDGVTQYKTLLEAAVTREKNSREDQEKQLFADLTGAIALDETLVEMTEGDDGQKIPTLPDMPEPFAGLIAKILAKTDEGAKLDAKELFTDLEPVDAQRLRRSLESVQSLSASGLKTAYANMARTADTALRNRRALPEVAPAEETLVPVAEKLAADLKYAEGVISSLVEGAEPGVQGDLKSAANRISDLVEKLRAEVTA